MSALDTSTTIAVIGAGTMGAGVAQVAAAGGHPVLLYDAVAGAAQKGIENTARGLERLVQRGRMSEAQRDELIGRITAVDTLESLAPASLFIEAIIENLEIKQQLFRQLEEIGGDDAILATNTSSISVTAIGAGLGRPERLLGMHFFNPAPIMKLVEIISGLATDPELAARIFDTAVAWGKQAVHARSTPGFIVNRVARPFYAEGLRLVQEGGADPATIDAIIRDCGGFRMGPTIQDTTDRDWDFMMDLNARTVFNTCRAVIPHMLARSYGRIVNVSARAATNGKAKMGPYCASKSAVLTLTESLAAENRFSGVNVNCVLPGTIDTPQNRADMPEADFDKWVPPAALADVMLFLASNAARCVSGAALPVYGQS